LNELTTKSSLSDSRRRLVELMQRLNFGRIQNLVVRDGEPVFDPAPKVIQKVKIGGENGPRPELSCEDFLLKKQTVELLDAIADLGDGTVLIIDVKHGLPFAVEIELAAAIDSARRARA
jgi:hypothetical protein